METGLPGKVGLPVVKRVAMGRGHVYDCVTIPLRPTKEKIVQEKEIIQKFVWSAIVQVNLIFLCWDIIWKISDASFSLGISIDLSKDISFLLVVVLSRACMFSSSVRCLYLMEIGLPGKVGLTCRKTCGNGSRIRVRLCNNPAPSHEGKYCEGEGKKIRRLLGPQLSS